MCVVYVHVHVVMYVSGDGDGDGDWSCMCICMCVLRVLLECFHSRPLSRVPLPCLPTPLRLRFGGACTAAAFLQAFVEPGVAWAHLDIAGTAMASKARGDMPEGGTGFGVRLLTDLLPRLAQAPAKA